MLVHCRVTPSIKFASIHLYSWVERGTVRVKGLAQEHNAMFPARDRTGLLDPKPSALTMRPLRLPHILQGYTLIKSIPVEGRAAMTVNGWPLLAELDGTGEFWAMDNDPWRIVESVSAPPEDKGHCWAASALHFKRKWQKLHTCISYLTKLHYIHVLVLLHGVMHCTA